MDMKPAISLPGTHSALSKDEFDSYPMLLDLVKHKKNLLIRPPDTSLIQ